MSAIAAIFRFDGMPVEPADLSSVLAAMASRSPDGQTLWVEGNVALGHGLLVNTPEAAHERQPVTALDGRMLMVWDGRLDNRGEIRHELALHGVTPRDETDPELVLQLYLIHREKTPERLLGDFALIVFDKQQQTLFCARDHVGARPLHYVLTDRLIAVASEDEALIPLLPNGARPNIDRVVYALIPILDDFDWSDGWIEGVKSLMPGTHMTVAPGRRIRRRQYWMFQVKPVDKNITQDNAVEAFGEVLERATRDRLRMAGSPAMLLSGGIDSACVAASAYRQTTKPTGMVAYSVVSDPGIDCVESSAIRTMIDKLGWHNHQISVPSFAGPMSEAEIGELAWQRPHPVNNSILLVAALAELAGRAGDRVLLNGVSGDLSFYAPDDYYLSVAQEKGWVHGFAELRLATQRHVYNIGHSSSYLLAQAAWTYWAPMFSKQLRPSRRRAARSIALNCGLDDRSIKEHHLVDRIRLAWARNDRFMRRTPNENHRDALSAPGIVRGLEGYDRVGGLAGVEMRDPLADVRVLEWLQQTPLSVRAFEGWTKWVGRQYVRKTFDESVAWRVDKAHLGFHLMDAANLRLPNASLRLSCDRSGFALVSDAVGFRTELSNGAATFMPLLHWVASLNR